MQDPSWQGRTREYTVPTHRQRIAKKAASSLTRQLFERLHEGRNGVPVVLTGATDHWPVMRKPWSKEHLTSLVGEVEVPVTSMQGHEYDEFRDPLGTYLANVAPQPQPQPHC